MLNFLKLFMLVLLLSLSSTANELSTTKPFIDMDEVKRDYLGKKYVWAATGPKAYDCSGFLQEVFYFNGIDLPRTSYEMVKVGKRVKKKNLREGDLIFLKSKKTNKVNHVAMIYSTKGKRVMIIHASKSFGKIVITPLSWYNSTYYSARRML